MCKVSSPAIPFPNETSGVANESVIVSVGHWQPAMVDYSVKMKVQIKYKLKKNQLISRIEIHCSRK